MTFTKLAILTLVSLSFTSSVFANPNFAQEMTVDGKKLVLNGVGTRKATIFKLKVYDAGLYVSEKGKVDPADDTVKVVRMEFLRDVTADDIRGAWVDGLAKNCPPPCPFETKEFLANIGPMKKGQIATYTLWPDKVKVEQPGRTDEYKQKGMATAILNGWIGPNPPNPELKDGMLGRGK